MLLGPFEKLGLMCHSQSTTQTLVALAKEQRHRLCQHLSVFCARAPADIALKNEDCGAEYAHVDCNTRENRASRAQNDLAPGDFAEGNESAVLSLVTSQRLVEDQNCMPIRRDKTGLIACSILWSIRYEPLDDAICKSDR